MAATAEPKGLDPLTLLRSGGEMKVGMAALDTKINAIGSNAKDAIELGANLRKVAKANSREAIENIAALKDNESKFELRNTKAFLERFGSGKKVVGNMTPEELASFNTAKQLLRENATVALYLDLRSKNSSERAALMNDAQVKEAVGMNPPDWTTIRKNALENIMRNDTFIRAFPEIHLSTLTLPEKMDYIEATLLPAEDRRFAARLGTLTQEAYRKAVDFTTVAGDDKKTGMETDKKVEEGRFAQRLKSLEDTLKYRGVKNPATGNEYTSAEIKTIIEGSADPKLAVDVLAQNILNQTPQIYSELKAYRVDLNDQLRSLNYNLTSRLAVGQSIAQYCAAHPNEKDVIDYIVADSKYQSLKAVYDPAGGPKGPTLISFDKDVLPLLSDPAFQTLVTDAKSAQSKASDLELKINALPPGDPAEVAKSRDKRLLEEQDLIGQLDRVLGNSLRDVLLERYDIMEERQGRLMEKNAKDAEKDVAKLVLDLKKKMNTRWISWDSSTIPQRKVDKKQIRDDVTHLTFSADKDVALKQLIARDIFGLANYKLLNTVDGMGGFRNLTPTELDQLNKVFESSGQAYKEKLWADMFMGRGAFDKTINLGFGIELGGDANESLAFKKAVRDEMMKKYDPEITRAIESKRESSQAMKNLEAQGIKFDFNMKWLWYVLTILLGLPAAAVGSVALPGGIAAAQAMAGGIAATGLTASAIEGAIGGAAGLAVPTVVGSAVGGKLASALEG